LVSGTKTLQVCQTGDQISVTGAALATASKAGQVAIAGKVEEGRNQKWG
jgi:hypothetical protein